MKKQNYANHIRFYIPHHFILLPIVLGLTAFSIRNACVYEQQRLIWIFLSVLSFSVCFLTFMVRQHYALGNQNRIVRLEFRLRYYELFGVSAQKIESSLTFSQIAALRFANDDEFKILLDKALKEHLSSDKIKKSIHDWQADDMRV